MKRIWGIIGMACFLCSGLALMTQANQNKVKVITTLFPLYDFVRQVGQDHVEVELLLPPGIEAHSFEPTPRDVVRINQAQLFAYTSAEMEPWAEDVVAGMVNKQIVIVNAGQNIVFEKQQHTQHHEGHHHDGHAKGDPHIWIDFDYAQQMVDAIASGLVRVDQQHADDYIKNADDLKNKIQALDEQYHKKLAHSSHRKLIHAGHFVFGYMAKRYGLEHVTAYRGYSPDSEPTPKQMIALMKTIRNYEVSYVFIEELIDPKLGRMIQEETGAQMLLLHGAHNITKKEMDAGLTYIAIMQKNLENLRKGLGVK